MVTIVCTRWFDAFPASCVNVLRNAVAAHLKEEHRFVCITDDPSSLGSGIVGVPMPDMGIPLQYQKKGCWPKMAMYKPGVLPPSDLTLFLDLDVVIRSDLTPFFDRMRQKPGFHALREWNPAMWNLLPLSMRPHRGVQSSIVGFVPEQHEELYEKFVRDPVDPCSRLATDQNYLTEAVSKVNDWPHEWTVSFKRSCVKYYPLNQMFPMIQEPQQAKVVVFHGDPRPVDLVPTGHHRWGTKRKFGHGPVDWVRDYWLRHDPTWTDAPAETKKAA